MIATSHIGSLPFVNVKEAIEFNRQFTLPCKFTLPQLNPEDFMMEQILGKDLSTFFRDSRAFLVNNYHPALQDTLYKFQLAGPITVWQAFKKVAHSREVFEKSYVDRMLLTLKLESKEHCYFFLDEPSLFLAEEPDYQMLRRTVRILKREVFKMGIHACSDFNENLISFADLDGFSCPTVSIGKVPDTPELDLFIGVASSQQFLLDLTFEQPTRRNELFFTPTCGLAFSDSQTLRALALYDPQ